MRLLVIDNYDSFTYNLVQLFLALDLEVVVHRNDRVSIADIERLAPDWICISPGPRDPAHAGISQDVVRRFAGQVPLLGVCLGMQAINEVFGGTTCLAPVPVHGKRCLIDHTGEGIFAGLPTPFQVARYHSLMSEVAPGGGLRTLATSRDGVYMAVQHEAWPVCGVQFHPESFLSEHGLDLVKGFLALRHRRSVA